MKTGLVILTGLLLAGRSWAADGSVDYLRQIKPLLSTKCHACHGALRQEGGLRLDAPGLWRRGGDSGPAVVSHAPSASPLWHKITASDSSERMPPEGEGEALTPEQLRLFETWITQGAAAPDEPIPTDPREHWAYQPLARPPLPPLPNAARIANPIDRFLSVPHHAHGLTPNPLASRAVLLRRVYLDLIGLPPTRDELHAFLADDAPDAYPRVVERLLNSPQYGERWGRHWMDIWRYSDWAGYNEEVRYSQRHIWRWRDWIVDSLNADQGYDQLVLAMLAADEYAPDDQDAVRATGFLARNWYKFDRNSWLDDTVEHTCRAFLGVTMRCARCHDHKYDPITQLDYYRLRAVFEPYEVRTDPLVHELEANVTGIPRVYDAKADAPTYLFVRGDPKRADSSHVVQPGVPAILGSLADLQSVSLPLAAYYPALTPMRVQRLRSDGQAAVAAAEREVQQAQERLSNYNVSTAAKASAATPTSADSPTGAGTEHNAAVCEPTLADRELALAAAKLAAAQLSLRAIDARIAAELHKYSVQADPSTSAVGLESNSTSANNLGEQVGSSEKLATSDDVGTSRANGSGSVLSSNAEPAESTAADGAALAELAAIAERLAANAAAEAALRSAQLALEQAGEAQRTGAAEADQQITKAREQLQQAEARQVELRKAAEQPTASYQPLGPIYPAQSSGRRLALARWIVDRRNPLTARVAVNHVWLRHFGQPLIESVDDLGLRTSRPPLSELLDYLALELIDSQWSLKHLHRLLVTSDAYCRASDLPVSAMPRAASERVAEAAPSVVTVANPAWTLDPDNRWQWRMPARRMEAELVRDAVYHLTGDLDLAQGGPDLDHQQGLSIPRRSLYFRHTPEKQMLFLQLFDAANPRECYRREESMRPQQALALVNSSLAIDQSRRLAARLMQFEGVASSDEQFLRAAFETVLLRPPIEAEQAACLEFLHEQSERLRATERLTNVGPEGDPIAAASDPRQRARENLMLVLLSHHEFVTIR